MKTFLKNLSQNLNTYLYKFKDENQIDLEIIQDELDQLKHLLFDLNYLIQSRNELIQIHEDSYNNVTNKYDLEEDENVDLLSERIVALLSENRDILSVETIIESLTTLGFAPSILYDDNGNFSISGAGFQSVSEDVSDTNLSFFVQKEEWFPTIRESLNYYLDSF